MRQHNASYDRFCAGCKARAEAKQDRRERNADVAAKMAKGTRRCEEAGPSRSVGKRTGGKPTQRERENDDDDSESSNNNRSSTQSQQADNQHQAIENVIKLVQVEWNTVVKRLVS